MKGEQQMVSNKLHKLRSLSASEWRLLWLSVFMLPLIAMLLRLAGFNRTKALLNKYISTGSDYGNLQQIESDQAHSIARMVSVAARHGPWRTNCLKQSLLLWWLLARHGLVSEIRFGVRNGPKDEFGAHAWVEYKGINLCDSDILQREILTFIIP